ncbi:hypothetical protein [Halobacteriovorax sp. CON-3]|uniref:hypothetical protein n=1 Tax=Halobacteriovorax sp. CON-3 TaxID=3157710 RepID=UPI0037172078
MKFIFCFLFILFTLNSSAGSSLPKNIFITTNDYAGKPILTMRDEMLEGDLEKEIVAYLEKEQGLKQDDLRKPFTISEELTNKVLQKFGISKDDSLYIYHTNDGHTSSHKISELGKMKVQYFYELRKYIVSNLGFSLEGIVKRSSAPSIAYFGKENLFLEKEFKAVSWSEGTKDMLELEKPSNKALTIKEEKFKSFVTKDLRIDMTDIIYDGDYVFRYGLRVSRDGVDFYDFDAGKDYTSRPSYIYVGKLFKNSSIVAFIDSMSLSKCASIIYVDDMDELDQIELRCQAQEC